MLDARGGYDDYHSEDARAKRTQGHQYSHLGDPSEIPLPKSTELQTVQGVLLSPSVSG